MLTFEMAGPATRDAPREPTWTRREMAGHVSGLYVYA